MPNIFFACSIFRTAATIDQDGIGNPFGITADEADDNGQKTAAEPENPLPQGGRGGGHHVRRHEEGPEDRSSQQAHELLENLLLWARSQTGTISFRPEPFDLKLRAEEIIELVAVQAARKNITILSDFNTGGLVTGDVNMMSTILRNLLTNALKFTPRNGEVRIGVFPNNGFCILTVKDNGIGIPAERLKHLFSIDTAHKTKGTDQEPGTGLGLILCREFIEKHGGRIEVESEVGKGSEFRVIIPEVPGKST